MIPCVMLIAALYVMIKGEYYIREGDVPSYLYHKFENIEDDVFPRDIRINMSLSTISGTLLYSIDRHRNQFIVTLYDNLAPTMNLEFSKQQFGISISQLCLCERCRYEPIDLRIQIWDIIYIQCNGGIAQQMKINRTMAIDKNYPIPFTDTEFNVKTKNEAHLWVVNNQKYNQVYPNSEQLSGCIFNIMYNTQPLTFTTISKNVESMCNRTCRNDICNGGQCYETFNKMPICNCTVTSENGIYCNNSMHPMNITTVSTNFTFGMFKLSWKSSSKRIFVLENLNIRIMLNQFGEELNFEYYEIKKELLIKRVLSKPYVPNSEYILVVAFSDNDLNIMISNKSTWLHKRIPNVGNLGKETFTSLSLISGSGIIDMVYKMSAKEYTWKEIKIVQYNPIKNEVPANPNVSPPSKNGDNRKTVIIASTTSVGLLLVLLLVLLVVVLIRKRAMGCCQPPPTESNPGESLRLLQIIAPAAVAEDETHSANAQMSIVGQGETLGNEIYKELDQHHGRPINVERQESDPIFPSIPGESRLVGTANESNQTKEVGTSLPSIPQHESQFAKTASSERSISSEADDDSQYVTSFQNPEDPNRERPINCERQDPIFAFIPAPPMGTANEINPTEEGTSLPSIPQHESQFAKPTCSERSISSEPDDDSQYETSFQNLDDFETDAVDPTFSLDNKTNRVNSVEASPLTIEIESPQYVSMAPSIISQPYDSIAVPRGQDLMTAFGSLPRSSRTLNENDEPSDTCEGEDEKRSSESSRGASGTSGPIDGGNGRNQRTFFDSPLHSIEPDENSELLPNNPPATDSSETERPTNRGIETNSGESEGMQLLDVPTDDNGIEFTQPFQIVLEIDPTIDSER